jgi:hypothetical protein
MLPYAPCRSRTLLQRDACMQGVAACQWTFCAHTHFAVTLGVSVHAACTLASRSLSRRADELSTAVPSAQPESISCTDCVLVAHNFAGAATLLPPLRNWTVSRPHRREVDCVVEPVNAARRGFLLPMQVD